MKKRILCILISLIILLGLVVLFKVNATRFSLELDEEGYLSLKHNLDNIKWYTIVWETDAGKLYGDYTDKEIYRYQSKEGYYFYSSVDDKVKWDSKDNDGNLYDIATIRVFVFTTSKDNPYNQKSEIIGTAELTISKEQSNFIKSKGRTFGNPHREDGKTDWQEIMILTEQSGHMVFRYRTGAELKKNEVLCWETSASPLSKGVISISPVYIPDIKNRKQFLISADTACFQKSEFPLDFFDGTTYYSSKSPYELTIKAFTMNKNKTKKEKLDMSFAKNVTETKFLIQDNIFITK